jgi:predicted transcriptional regulator
MVTLSLKTIYYTHKPIPHRQQIDNIVPKLFQRYTHKLVDDGHCIESKPIPHRQQIDNIVPKLFQRYTHKLVDDGHCIERHKTYILKTI